MSKKNPFLVLLILWAVALGVSLGACVANIIVRQLIVGFVDLLFVVFDSLLLGYTFCQYWDYRQMSLEYERLLEQRTKRKVEPFEEFENVENEKSE